MATLTNSGEQRLFVIHAGTHKTATTYIQSRIMANLDLLAAAGVHVSYPGDIARKHKPLAEDLGSRELAVWRRFLQNVPKEEAQVLISAEQFTQPLARPRIFRRLQRLLAEHGFRLRIVVFLRDQPDYMNARFVHSTRRLYHCQPFESYVEQQLNEGELIYNYSRLFARLLDAAAIETCFLPFASGLGDPYERLMQSQGWCSPQPWRPADPSQGNIQPGCRGVWLAQAVMRQMQERHGSWEHLLKASATIRQIAEREGWIAERYQGS